MTLLNKEARLALSQRNPREKVKCPVCDKEAELSRNGDWKCIASEKLAFNATQLTCGARGVSLGKEMIPISKPYADSSLRNSDTA